MHNSTLPHIAAIAAVLVVSSPFLQSAAAVDFDRDIRPILSDNCFQCHGPDEARRKAGVRLDTREGALAVNEGRRLVAPGRPDQSELIRRIDSNDPDDQMPPPDAKKSFGEKERALLRQWVAEGAAWSEHWALIPPTRNVVPGIENSAWARNPIDNFVAVTLADLGLAPSPEASRETLIRRLSLDLTGLPPAPAEVDAFLADTERGAYDRVVDRLLASPHFGERMAWPWLDAARYADTNGYQGDNERTMYPWRDWVIRAFNENMPYDQFTIEQLAGDLLPQPTRDQKLATAFNRNHMINGEGGRIPEENRVEYIFDQLETVGTVWLGLTMNCCRCHDHKYDPLTKEDYYRFFAFFNQTPVNGAGGDPRSAPNLAIHSEETEARLAALRDEAGALETSLGARRAELEPRQADWERETLAGIVAANRRWSKLAIQHAEAASQQLAVLEDGSILASGDNAPTDTYLIAGAAPSGSIHAVRLEALRHESLSPGGLSRSDSGNFVLTDFRVSLRQPDGTKVPLKFDSAMASFEQGGYTVDKALDSDSKSGWAVYEGRPIERGHEAIFRLKEPVAVPADSTLVVALAHNSEHAGHNLGRFRLSVSAESGATFGSTHQDLESILSSPRETRNEADAAKVADAFLKTDPSYRDGSDRLQRARQELSDIDASAVKVMIMEDMEESRKTFTLRTGLYSQPETEVTADVPGALFDLPPDAPRNRLGLARWLVDTRNPLTARVTVNRVWAELFGQGLVKSAENFGVQGEKPSHPELLDWLAVDFMESGWDVKALLRLIVTSATYRQSSDTDAERLAIDPDNKYLSRGPRFRMPSWMIRDQALAAGGLLVATLGGPPVKPYQPDGLWQEFSFGNLKYQQDSGDALYRRSLYTYWRRIVAPPLFFDSSTRQTCSVKSPRTNSPMHALTTLNDPGYVEAARAMAEGLLQAPDKSDAARIDTAFRISLARAASAEETSLLLDSVARLRREFGADPDAAQAYINVGESAPAANIDPVEHAAYAALCLSILNTDEALTKE